MKESIPVKVLAAEEQIICPQPYGGGVVCGVHTVVNTGLGDNLGLIGVGIILASIVLFLISKKLRKTQTSRV
jgi:hypothetical protein